MKTDTNRSCVLTSLGGLMFMAAGVVAPSNVAAQTCTPQDPPLAGSTDPMNRYIAFRAPKAWAGRTLALRITLVDLDGFSLPPVPTRWVGDPQSFPDEDSSIPDKTFLAAKLACGSVYREWSTMDVLHVYGSEIVPSSTYELQTIEFGCDEGDEASYSAPLGVVTGKFGDVWPVFYEPGTSPQPNKNDIAAMVRKYQWWGSQCQGGANDGLACSGSGDCPSGSCDRTAPIKAMAQFQPNIPEPSYPISMREITLDVDAFSGRSYAAIFAGAETCPYRVPQCGDGVLDPGEECDDGNAAPGDGCSPACRGENATAVFRLVPINPPAEVGVSYPAGVVINGNEFLLPAGAVRLWFELQLSGWGDLLDVWQATLGLPFANGLGADLVIPFELCDVNADCVEIMGPGSRCVGSPASKQCEAGFIDPDNVRSPFTPISAVSQPTLTFGATTLPGFPGATDDGGVYYLGTLVLDVPSDAVGVYTIGIAPDLRVTFLLEDSVPPRLPIPIAALEPAVVRVAEGCCFSLSCTNMLPQDCLASGGVPVGLCGGDCNGNGRSDACEIAGGLSNDCNGNDLPDDCEADCNANGVADDCDLGSGTSFDCNANDVPDECDLDDAVSFDCNANTVPDECDISAGTSDDCNFDDVPDDCQPDADCNGNGVRDICDIGAGTSDDCNFDLVPDDCQPDEDCNANSVRDICDIGAGAEPDCNANLSLDSCDIASGGSFDDNVDGVPDECCQPPTPVFVLEKKSRYLSLASIGTIGVRQALRVTFVDNASYPELNFQSLWVGAPREYPEADTSQPGLTFTGAGLSCTPHYQDWSAIDVLQVFGAEIVPESTYAVQLINEGCPEAFQTNYSGALPASTGKWGDQWPLFDAPANPPQPDFSDIAASVRKFRARGSQCAGGANDGQPCAGAGDCPSGSCATTAPIKALAQLQPSVPIPGRPIDFKDIAATTSAFSGARYVNTVPNAGPCACPSDVTCSVTPCMNDLECGTGLCIDGFCTDACGRCSP